MQPRPNRRTVHLCVSPSQVLALAIASAVTVAFLSLSVVHRNGKPSNATGNISKQNFLQRSPGVDNDPPPAAKRPAGLKDSASIKERSSTPSEKFPSDVVNSDVAVAARTAQETSDIPFHFVVSSDCSSYQRWQVLTQIQSARSVEQHGKYTWIVSGCPDLNSYVDNGPAVDPDLVSSEIIKKDVADHFGPRERGSVISYSSSVMVDVPNVHFSPDYSDMSLYGGLYADGKVKRTFVGKNGKTQYGNYGNKYKFNNKPNGLRHWSDVHFKNQPFYDELIVLIDPDFLFLATFDLPADLTVTPGQPAAAKYGLGAQWLDFNRTAICGEGSPCMQTTLRDVRKHYAAGPPYVIHSQDVLRLATFWSSFVPPIYDQYPLLYAEMYAYSAAAAHLELPHSLINGLYTGCMIQWPSDIDTKQKSALKASADRFKDSIVANTANDDGASSCFLAPYRPPPLLHLCSRYEMRVGKANSSEKTYFFKKRKVDHSILDCENDGFWPFLDEEIKVKAETGNEEWNALAICTMLRAINYARVQHCGSAGDV